MPLHHFRCVGETAHEFERFIRLPDWDKAQLCECGARAEVFYPNFPGMFTPGGASATEDREFYYNHNITYTGGSAEVKHSPNSHSEQCQCESCGRHRRRASVTDVADVKKEVRL